MRRPRNIRFSAPFKQADFTAVTKLVRELWLITDDLAQYQIRSYREHIRECRKVKDDTTIASEKVSDILELCDQVNSCISLSLEDTYDKVCARYTTDASQQQIQDRSIQEAFAFAVRLCHFIQLDPELRRGPQSIKQVLRDSLAGCTSWGPDRILQDEFCEKNLTRRANVEIRYTSNLTRHLELQGNQLFVFRHGTALKAYAGDSRMCDIYPPDFLLETQATIDLIFPVSENRLARRRQRLSEKNFVDLEVGDLGTETGDPDRQLNNYQYWGRRLAIIDDRYQSSKPGRLKQWYYDRRDANSFTMFWFTLSAFVLAVIFGLISSVTAIMQTWKVYHP